jgi:hypothetical protein
MFLPHYRASRPVLNFPQIMNTELEAKYKEARCLTCPLPGNLRGRSKEDDE